MVIEGGYPDIGLIDTMKDLMVNFIGAVVYCVSGYLYANHRIRRSVTSKMTILPEEDAMLPRDEESSEDR